MYMFQIPIWCSARFNTWSCPFSLIIHASNHFQSDKLYIVVWNFIITQLSHQKHKFNIMQTKAIISNEATWATLIFIQIHDSDNFTVTERLVEKLILCISESLEFFTLLSYLDLSKKKISSMTWYDRKYQRGQKYKVRKLIVIIYLILQFVAF